MTDENYPTGTGGRSLLGAGSRITGSIYVPGTIELPGQVKGRVEASTVVVDETGEVKGEIHAVTTSIRGQFSGEIMGGNVTLHATAQVTGKITYQSLSIETGARVEVECRRKPST